MNKKLKIQEEQVVEQYCENGLLTLIFQDKYVPRILGLDSLNPQATAAPVALVVFKIKNICLIKGYFDNTVYNPFTPNNSETIKDIAVGIDLKKKGKEALFLKVGDKIVKIDHNTPFTSEDFVCVYWENNELSSITLGAFEPDTNKTILTNSITRSKNAKNLFKNMVRTVLTNYDIDIQKSRNTDTTSCTQEETK